MRDNINFDIFYTYKKAPQLYFKKYTLKSLRLLALSVLKDFFNIFRKGDTINNKIWIISNTLNNRNVSNFINNHFDNSIIINIGFKKFKNEITIQPYNNFIFKFFKTIKILCNSDELWDKHNLHYIYEIIGFENKIEKILKRSNPNVIIFSNDHYYYNRILLKKAREKKIKTIYIPHASISKVFPKLEFDYSFLYGQQMKDVYLDIGKPYGEIYLTGSIRSENLKYLQKKEGFDKTIGIAINPMDDVLEVKKIVIVLLADLCIKNIIVRFHPRMKINKFIIDSRVKYTSASKESIITFFSSINILIAGNSGIHLEAALSKTKSITFYFNNDVIYDYYQFIENNISQYCSNVADLKYILGNKIVYPEKENLIYYDYSVSNLNKNETRDRILKKIEIILK